MTKITISVTLKCRSCNRAEKHGFKGLGESHAFFFKQAKQAGVMHDWDCPNCGPDQVHDVMNVSIEEELPPGGRKS